MKKLSIFLVVVLVFSMLQVGQVNGKSLTRDAKVVETSGKATFKRGGEKTYKVFKGLKLRKGDVVLTGKDGKVIVEIDGDKRVTIGKNTSIVFSELTGLSSKDSDQTKMTLNMGSVMSKIDKKLKNTSSYEIETPTTIMGVKGTIVSNNRTPEKEGVTSHTKEKTVVLDGKVEGTIKTNIQKANNEYTGSKEIGYALGAGKQLLVDEKIVKKAKEAMNQQIENSEEEPIISLAQVDEKYMPEEVNYEEMTGQELEIIDEIIEEIKQDIVENPNLTNIDVLKKLVEQEKNIREIKKEIQEKETQIEETIEEIYNESEIIEDADVVTPVIKKADIEEAKKTDEEAKKRIEAIEDAYEAGIDPSTIEKESVDTPDISDTSNIPDTPNIPSSPDSTNSSGNAGNPAPVYSNNANIATVGLNVEIVEWDKELNTTDTQYTITVASGTKNVVFVPTLSDNTASISGLTPTYSLVSGEVTISFTVTAQSGYQKKYTFLLKEEKSKNANLSSLVVKKIDGTNIPLHTTFFSSKRHYIVYMEAEQVKIEATTSHEKAKIETDVSQAIELIDYSEKVQEIDVTAQDGSTKKYTVLFDTRPYYEISKQITSDNGAGVAEGEVDITWTVPNRDTVTHYDIYVKKDVKPLITDTDAKVNTENIAGTNYTLTIPNGGKYYVGVVATFDTGKTVMRYLGSPLTIADGTSQYPVLLRTPEELQKMGKGTPGYEADLYYHIPEDIVWGEQQEAYEPPTLFTGTIDGKNSATGKVSTIVNLKVKEPAGDNVGGLYNKTDGATIKNIGIIYDESLGLTSFYNGTGGLVGNAKNTTIENCYVIGNITAKAQGEGKEQVGGIVGIMEDSTIKDSYFIGEVEGKHDIGGIAGKTLSTITRGNLIKNCYTIGKIKGSVERAGGIVGDSYKSVITHNIAYMASIDGQIDRGRIIGKGVETTLDYNYGNENTFLQKSGGHEVVMEEEKGKDTLNGSDIAKFPMNMDDAPYTVNTVSQWDFTTPIWEIKNEAKRPTLSKSQHDDGNLPMLASLELSSVHGVLSPNFQPEVYRYIYTTTNPLIAIAATKSNEASEGTVISGTGMLAFSGDFHVHQVKIKTEKGVIVPYVIFVEAPLAKPIVSTAEGKGNEIPADGKSSVHVEWVDDSKNHSISRYEIYISETENIITDGTLVTAIDTKSEVNVYDFEYQAGKTIYVVVAAVRPSGTKTFSDIEMIILPADEKMQS